MPTAPVALAHLDDEQALVKTARAISELTQYDPDTGDACVFWCTAIRRAVLTGELDARIGMAPHRNRTPRPVGIPTDGAEESRHAAFAPNNGWVVAALQAAWSAIATTPSRSRIPPQGGAEMTGPQGSHTGALF